jgi:hypothetical protein
VQSNFALINEEFVTENLILTFGQNMFFKGNQTPLALTLQDHSMELIVFKLSARQETA